MFELSGIGGKCTNVFPNVIFLRVKIDGSVEKDKVYTIDVIPGFAGAYPNFILQIDLDQVDDFVEEYKKIDSFEAYHSLVDKYGVRRSHMEFWTISDWFYKKHQHENKVFAGLFDLNRYKNR